MKYRKCRECGNKYKVPSDYPGCCSKECKIRRTGNIDVKRTMIRKLGDISKNDNRWFRLRYEALRKYGSLCMLCGSKDRLQIDHIKPRSKFPKLTYDINNLQILCMECNKGKGAKYFDDWRPETDLIMIKSETK